MSVYRELADWAGSHILFFQGCIPLMKWACEVV